MTVYFTEDHEWISVDGEAATVGITTYAQAQLGDIVFVEVPEVGKALKKGDEAAVVESVKAASEVYAPVTGTVTEANTALADAPETVNASPEADGWFMKLTLANPAELDGLMDKATYDAFVAGL
ncbi:Glycine cleavage system H protein [Hartmannibacter diazotrophicus]|uniref:Glycine cleavage system H protein n=1 Tax=Hartmannibacter diazotrophicus TaxID=1482074 RepID=A0A2C9D3E9_9HYPH|nr:glycine cleavage system protein GcvH [Hartmannibacter diazotrophicus]SON54794.1 Glycine cleavage system H protein [Hartmannibacter diazotrophicus]